MYVNWCYCLFHSHSHRNLVIWGKPCRRFSLQVKRQLSQVQEVATEARFLGGRKIWCQEEILNKSSETVHMAICLLVLYMCIYIYIYMNMKPYGNEIFSNNQRYADVFCRGVFFWQQAAKRAKEAEQKMAQEVGNIRSGSWIIGWTQWWMSIPKLIAKALRIHVSSKTL